VWLNQGEPWTIFTTFGWFSMEVDLRNILVTPYLETDDASGGGGVNGLSGCSLCEKLTECWKQRY
jgi:hypothetical protein